MKLDKNEFTIYEVEALHKELLENSKNEQDVILDMESVNKIDVSIIQLFIAAKKSATAKSKKFRLENVNSEVAKILQSAGCGALLGVENE